jgi:hypothetical protein
VRVGDVCVRQREVILCTLVYTHVTRALTIVIAATEIRVANSPYYVSTALSPASLSSLLELSASTFDS